MRDVDATSRIKKACKLHVDFLITDVILMRYISLFCTVTYLQILVAALYKKFCIIQKIKILWCQKMFFKKTAFSQFKILALQSF